MIIIGEIVVSFGDKTLMYELQGSRANNFVGIEQMKILDYIGQTECISQTLISLRGYNLGVDSASPPTNSAGSGLYMVMGKPFAGHGVAGSRTVSGGLLS